MDLHRVADLGVGVDLDPYGVDLDPGGVDLDPDGVDLDPGGDDLDPAGVDTNLNPIQKKNWIWVSFPQIRRNTDPTIERNRNRMLVNFARIRKKKNRSQIRPSETT